MEHKTITVTDEQTDEVQSMFERIDCAASKRAHDLADKAADIIEVVKDKFAEADEAYYDAAQKAGLSPMEAMITLISIHRAASDRMERFAAEMVVKYRAHEDDEELKADDEEE